MKTYCVYKITRDDGLEYVGETRSDLFKRRMREHASTRRFQGRGFTYQILKDDLTYEDSLIVEEQMILKFDTFKNGLNMTHHGRGANKSYRFNTKGLKFTEEHKQKLRKSGRRRFLNGTLKIQTISNKEKAARIAKMTKTKREQAKLGICTKPRKFTEDIITELYLLYKSKPHLENVGQKQKGCQHILTYDSAFARNYAKKFNMTPNYVLILLQGKADWWKPLYEKILQS